MKKINTKTITFTALLIALAIALPRIAHIYGQGIGLIWLPMHLVVLLAGISLGPAIGLGLGLMTPLLSFAISGMPPIPLLWFVTIEVAFYGLAGGLLHKQAKLPVWASLGLAQIAGRGAIALALFVAARWIGITGVPAATAIFTTSLATGLPGIALQWAVIPKATDLLEKNLRRTL